MNLWLWKISLNVEKHFLMENFIDQGNIFASQKVSWTRKNIFLWKDLLLVEKFLLVKNFLIKEIHLFIENLFDQENIFVYGKFLWLGKSLDFWNKEKSWLVEKSQFVWNFIDHGKIIGLSLLKMKLYNITNTNVKTTTIYISKSCAKTQLA